MALRSQPKIGMGNERILNILGLARRASMLALGQDKTIKSILDRKAKLVVLSKDCGAAAKRQITGKAETAGIRILTLGSSREELGQAVGIPGSSAIGVLDAGFAALIESGYREQVED
jgi:ribosomal protein L7Ae-like RNA K-turn-binding protein